MALPTAATTLTASAGYIPTGLRKVWLVPTIATTTAPTLTELNAGTDVTPKIASMSGFSGTGATVDLPNMAARWTPKVTGLISADDSSIDFNMDTSSTDVRALFNDGSDGTTPTKTNIVIFYEGVVSGGKMRAFPVQVTSVSASTDIASVAILAVTFSIILPPSSFVAIPVA